MQHSYVKLSILWLLIMMVFSYGHQREMDNQIVLSRLDLLHALVFEKTCAIDVYENNTLDKAFYQGHYYCDKAPGSVFISFFPFLVCSEVLANFAIPPNSRQAWFCSDWVTVASSISAISALGAVCLFLWLNGFMPSRMSLLCTLVMAFGSSMLPYATMMLSHGLVVGLLGMALFVVKLGWNEQEGFVEARSLVGRDFLGGIACGLAIASEFDAALVAGGILAVAFVASIRRGYGMMLGATLPLLLIPLYNWLCFGNPFSLSYGHEAVFNQMDNGFYGIHFPNTDNALHLLVSPERGLLFWTPFLILAYPGFFLLFDKSRPVCWLCFFIPLIQILIMSGYYTITAGSTLGARFLVPVLPLLILPAGMAASKVRWLAAPLAFYSITSMTAATFVDVKLPFGESNPLFNYYLPELLKGHFTLTLGEVVGLRPPWSILPLLVVVLPCLAYLWWQTGKPVGPEENKHLTHGN